jgi:hypothetical protein
MGLRHCLEQAEATCEGGVKDISRGLLPGMKVSLNLQAILILPSERVI